MTRHRLQLLQKDGAWTKSLKILEDSHVKPPEKDVENRGSEGRRTQSWIWEMSGAMSEQASSTEGTKKMQVEWAKSRAPKN